MKKKTQSFTVVPDWPVICSEIVDTDISDKAIVKRYKLPEFERIDLDGFLKDAGLKRGCCGRWHWLDENCYICALTAPNLKTTHYHLWRVKRGQIASNRQQTGNKDDD